VWDETVAADPDGEVIVMPFIDAEGSVVVTPAGIAWGPKHDGATAGHNSKYWPVSAVELGFTRAYVPDDEVPYVEAVIRHAPWSQLIEERVHLTQIRATAKIQRRTTPVRVAQVVQAEGDGLAWEATMARFGKVKPEGLIVWHPGGNEVSHYAVHAGINGLPIVFTDEAPVIGSVIKFVPPKLVWNKGEFRKGVALALRYEMADPMDYREAVLMVLFTLHQSVALLQTRQGSLLLGFAATLMTRLGGAAAVGEARHGWNIAKWEESGSREGNYRALLGKRGGTNFVTHRGLVDKALYLFNECSWGQGSGYGGKKWHACLQAVVTLDTAVRAAARPGSKADHTGVVAALNVAVNQAHNNGWWMNKFASSDLFDEMARGSLKLNIGAIHVLHNALSGSTKTPLLRAYTSAPDHQVVELDVEQVCRKARHPEGTCGGCRSFECQCCGECSSYPCACESESCGECGSDPCECCGECERSPCRCNYCDECHSDPCDCPGEDESDPDEAVVPRESWKDIQQSRYDAVRSAVGFYAFKNTCTCVECSAFSKEYVKQFGVEPSPLGVWNFAEFAKTGAPVTSVTDAPTASTDVEEPVSMNLGGPPYVIVASATVTRLQVCIRAGWQLHFQLGLLGKDGTYLTHDMQVSSKDRAVTRDFLKKMPASTSLAGTDTPYRVLTNLSSLPFTGTAHGEWTNLIKWARSTAYFTALTTTTIMTQE
jgi:hypothetical protein